MNGLTNLTKVDVPKFSHEEPQRQIEKRSAERKAEMAQTICSICSQVGNMMQSILSIQGSAAGLELKRSQMEFDLVRSSLAGMRLD